MSITHTRKQEETAVLAVLDGIHEAWNQADPDAFVADYLENASAILPGRHMKSRTEIHDSMAYSFNGPLKGTRTSNTVLNIQFLTTDTAVVVSQSGVLIPGESAAPPERTSLATWVLTKQDDKWLVAAYSNSPSTMPGPGQ